MYSEPVRAQPQQKEPPLVLTRGVWAGGQRHGIVLWSSDIHSSFEQLASQVPQGVHASMSGANEAVSTKFALNNFQLQGYHGGQPTLEGMDAASASQMTRLT